MDLGNWEGMSIEEVRAVAADNLQAFFYSPPDFTPAGRGETYGDVTARVGRFLTEMEERALCATVRRLRSPDPGYQP
jgi:broad specificity phosphatase PhoE